MKAWWVPNILSTYSDTGQAVKLHLLSDICKDKSEKSIVLLETHSSKLALEAIRSNST